MFPPFVFLNIICVVILYVLLCNTAIIKYKHQKDNKYIYDKSYIIDRLIVFDKTERLTMFYVVFLLTFIPVTWLLCVGACILIFVLYCLGHVEVFGKMYRDN